MLCFLIQAFDNVFSEILDINIEQLESLAWLDAGLDDGAYQHESRLELDCRRRRKDHLPRKLGGAARELICLFVIHCCTS
jgi:hypothetical protein